MPGCAVYGCKSYNRKTKGTNIKYFRFPKNEDLVRKWVEACQRKDKVNLKHACICSLHFSPTSFEIPLRQQLLNYTPANSRHLKSDAVPTENLPSSKKYDGNTSHQDQQEIPMIKQEDEQTIHQLFIKTPPTEDEITIKSENNEDENMLDEFNQNVGTNVANRGNISGNKDELQQKLNLLAIENRDLRRKNDELIKKLKEAKNNELTKIKAILKGIFTPGQIRRLINPLKRIRWSTEDIASAISLRRVSPKAYRYLRSQNYPLPALSTLRASCIKRWSKLNQVQVAD